MVVVANTSPYQGWTSNTMILRLTAGKLERHPQGQALQDVTTSNASSALFLAG